MTCSTIVESPLQIGRFFFKTKPICRRCRIKVSSVFVKAYEEKARSAGISKRSQTKPISVLRWVSLTEINELGPNVYDSDGLRQALFYAGAFGKFGLRILYVGLPGTEPQDDFVRFLRRHGQTNGNYSVRPWRYGGSTNALASGRFVNFMAWASHSSFVPGIFRATTTDRPSRFVALKNISVPALMPCSPPLLLNDCCLCLALAKC